MYPKIKHTSPLTANNSIELRECLRNGTLSLRDLDNKKRGSSKGRRRRRKTKTGEPVVADHDTKATQAPGNSPKVTKSSKTKKDPKEIGVNLQLNSQAKESERIVRSILDDVFDSVSRHFAAIEHSVAREQANELADVFLASFDERVVLRRKVYLDQRRETQKLIYKAAKENVNDLIIRATKHYCQSQDKEHSNALYPLDLLHSAEFEARMRVRVEQINAEKMAMQQTMQKTASEIVEDLFTSATHYASLYGAPETEPINKDVATRKFYIDQRRETHELKYKAAQENVNDLIVRATKHCGQSQDMGHSNTLYTLDLFRSPDFEARMRVRVEQIKAEKLAMQQTMYKSASEIVEDLFTSAAYNVSLPDAPETYNAHETELIKEEEGDFEVPVRGWRKFLCCAKASNQKKKKEKSGLLARLRRLFSRH
ncbi:uncharacterized protein LOC133202947 [Saccostrea echinata]|uniref:uncharacterized protein LOC133202947 n=1 Tax=Saccostrea echinata TaxID=191078 RepID=UPI002A8188F6|nr:uncharacterized protein LOC133202947 [Saccostrea echinata]